MSHLKHQNVAGINVDYYDTLWEYKEFFIVYVSVFKKKKSIDKITSWESPRGVIVCNQIKVSRNLVEFVLIFAFKSSAHTHKHTHKKQKYLQKALYVLNLLRNFQSIIQQAFCKVPEFLEMSIFLFLQLRDQLCGQKNKYLSKLNNLTKTTTLTLLFV